MKKLLIITAVLCMGIASQAFAASYSVGINLDARVGGFVVGGGTAFERFSVVRVTNADGTTSFSNVTAGGEAIGVAADEIDDSEITFTASVDNVSASVKFEREASDNALIKFDSAHLQVSDLFGMLTVRFFDWGYSAGSSKNEGNYILSDIGFQGFYLSVKPIDLVSVGAGFGLNADSLRGLRLDLQIGGPVPTGIYFGVTINSIDNAGGIVEEGTIERLQVGFESKLYGDYLTLGVGLIPLGSTLKYYKTSSSNETTNADGTTTIDSFIVDADPTIDTLSFAVSVSGGASLLDGLLGIDYALQYTHDTLSKALAAGRGSTLTVVDSDGEGASVYPDNHSYQAHQAGGGDLWETIAFKISPYINVGQFTLGAPIKYQYYGTTYSGYQLREEPLHRLGLDRYITWKPASGFSVTAELGFDFTSQSVAIPVPELGDYALASSGPSPSSAAGLPLGLEDIFAKLQINVAFGVSSE